MGLDYVDIFYSHGRPETPIEETMGALVTAVHRAGRSTSASLLIRRRRPLRRPPSCAAPMSPASFISRRTDVQSLDRTWSPRTLAEEGIGCIAFSPLAQGLLSVEYLHGVPEGRARQPPRRRFALARAPRRTRTSTRARARQGIRRSARQTLAQMASLDAARPTGHHRPHRCELRRSDSENVGALENLAFRLPSSRPSTNSRKRET